MAVKKAFAKGEHELLLEVLGGELSDAERETFESIFAAGRALSTPQYDWIVAVRDRNAGRPHPKKPRPAHFGFELLPRPLKPPGRV